MINAQSAVFIYIIAQYYTSYTIVYAIMPVCKFHQGGLLPSAAPQTWEQCIVLWIRQESNALCCEYSRRGMHCAVNTAAVVSPGKMLPPFHYNLWRPQMNTQSISDWSIVCSVIVWDTRRLPRGWQILIWKALWKLSLGLKCAWLRTTEVSFCFTGLTGCFAMWLTHLLTCNTFRVVLAGIHLEVT